MATKIFVPGGAGYVGGILVPKLLAKGYEVVVYDLYIYGKDVFDGVRGHPGLTEIEGDVRDTAKLRKAVEGCQKVIHLACISNDPSCDLDPDLSSSINYTSFPDQVQACKDAGVERFIFASSSSVYGLSDSPNVDESHARVPVSDYNRYKAKCEDYLWSLTDFPYVIVRPATVCGYSPRLRLDLTVNVLTAHAVTRGKMTVFGGTQFRPNLHIQDMTDLYLMLLEEPLAKIKGQTYNAGYQNMSVAQIAETIKDVIETDQGKHIDIETTPSNDIRSYRITTTKLENELGFKASHTIEDAARELTQAFADGRLPMDALTSTHFNNIKRMQEIDLQ